MLAVGEKTRDGRQAGPAALAVDGPATGYTLTVTTFDPPGTDLGPFDGPSGYGISGGR